MTNYRYLTVFVIFAIISVVVAQKFTDQRKKLKFRPPSDWFAEMQPQPMEQQSPNYFDPENDPQSDQPAPDNNDFMFQHVYVEDYEPEESQSFGGSKFARHLEVPHFQSLCPIKAETIYLNGDSSYEYRPSSYNEVKCLHPFGRNAKMHLSNKVCGHHGFSCIQRNRTLFLSRRPLGSDCWEVETRVVPSACECMWPMHAKGDIIHHH